MPNRNHSKTTLATYSHAHSGGSSAATEHKEREAVLRPFLWDRFRESHPLVWYKADSGYRARRAALRSEDNEFILLKHVKDNGFNIIATNRIHEDIPQDFTQADADLFERNVDSYLVPNFEIQVMVKYNESYYNFYGRLVASQVERFITVDSFRRCSNNGRAVTLSVTEAGSAQRYTVALSSLKAVETGDTRPRMDDIRRLQNQLAHSNKMNGEVEKELRQTQDQLTTAHDENRRVMTKLNDCQTQLTTQKSNAADSARQRQRLTNTITQLKGDIGRLEREATSARGAVKNCKTQIKQNEDQIKNLRRERDGLQREGDQQMKTIDNFEKKIAVDQAEIRALRQDLDQAYRRIAEHQDEVRVFQQQTQELQNAREQNDRLRTENENIQRKLGELHPTIIQPYRSYDFGKEMAELRDQKLEDAVEVFSSVDLDDEDAGKLIFRIFMFVYRFSQERLADIRRTLNTTDNDLLNCVFTVKLQDYYTQTFDSGALEMAFLEAFSSELGEEVASNENVLEFVRKSGEICWCVVIRLEPKLRFLPTEQVDSEIMFDSVQFKDVTSQIRKGDTAKVLAYVLPGLYRVDARSPVSLDARPCVYPKKIRKVAAVAHVKTEVSVPPSVQPDSAENSDVPPQSKEELKHLLEEDIWNGNVDDAKEKLRRLGMSTFDIEIRCAEDGCGAVIFKRWYEYEKFNATGGACECPQDEDHMNVFVQRKQRKW